MKPTTSCVSSIVIVNDSKNKLIPDDGKNIDPRSPAGNFDRTPIIKPKTSEDLQSDSLELKNDSSNVVMSYSEVMSQLEVPEVQVLPEINTKKAVNLEGSLSFNNDVDETNIDAQDLSEIIMKKPVNLETRLNFSDDVDEVNDDSLDNCSSDGSEPEEQITVIPNLKSSKFNNNHMMDQTINEVLFENELEDDLNVESNLKETKNDKELHGKIRVWRDSTSPQLRNEITRQTGKNPQEIIIEFDDDTVITSLKSEVKKLPVKIEDKVKNKIVENNQVGRALKTKSWNKEIKIVRDDVKDINDTMKNRTPLGNRSNNTKSSERGKSPHQILINKGLFTKQQENTPPTKRFKGKNLNGTIAWDPDMSVII